MKNLNTNILVKNSQPGLSKGIVFPDVPEDFNAFLSPGLPKVYRDLAPNLLALYDFSEKEGNILHDKSGNAIGENLIPSASSNFDTDGTAFWNGIRGANTWDSTNKNLIFTSNSSANDIHGLNKNGLIAANKIYLVTFKAKSATETSTINFIGNLVENGFTAIKNPALSSSWQDYEGIFIATSTQFYLGYRAPTPIGETVEFDDIILQESHHGILKNFDGNQWSNGGRGGLMSDGVNDYVDTGIDIDLPANDFSIHAIIQKTTGSCAYIISMSHTIAGYSSCFFIGNSAGYIAWFRNITLGNGGLLDQNDFNFVTLSWNKSIERFELFHNESNLGQSNLVDNYEVEGTLKLFSNGIGASNCSAGLNNFCLLNKALTFNEHLALYNYEKRYV